MVVGAAPAYNNGAGQQTGGAGLPNTGGGGGGVPGGVNSNGIGGQGGWGYVAFKYI